MNLRRIALLSALALSAIGTAGAAAASAAPIWNLEIHHNETHFPPGGTGQYWFDVENVGDEATSGPVTLTVFLPGGLTRESVGFQSVAPGNWSCPGSAGESIVTCTSAKPIPRHGLDRDLMLSVNVHPAIEEGVLRLTSATLSGGGAAQAASDTEPTRISSKPAAFGIVEQSFFAEFLEADAKTVERQAGAHPDNLTVSFDLNSVDTGEKNVAGWPYKRAAGAIRNVVVELPPGFVGAPTAVGECTAVQLTIGKCPPSSQVGRADVVIDHLVENPVQLVSTGVYNMVHPRGTVTDLAFVFADNPVHIKASLDPANRYAIRVIAADINETLPPFSSRVVTWGVPGDPSHDSERCGGQDLATDEECPAGGAPKPFLSLPAQCEEEGETRLRRYDSWQSTGEFGPDVTYPLAGKFEGCEKPRFEPTVEIEPTGRQANTPTGLDVRIKVAQNENPNALATPPMKRATVRLPEGMSFSPSFADGLQACTLAQMRLLTNAPVDCPDASRIGEVRLSTPLLPKTAEGSMYLAAQRDNPYGSTFALLLVIHDTEERGVLIKVPGRIDVDPASGQITTVFDELPQFPFDDMTLKFRSGPRAPLVSPPACGTHRIEVEVASWAQPLDPVDRSNTYQVSEGPNGAPCPSAASQRPFAPRFSAGTLNPVAGAYSPFLFRLSREDSEQELTGVRAVLPPGLVGRIAGKSFCPEHALASISTAELAGAGERDNPACPASSELGSLAAGLGAGPGPNYFPGKLYLAGPYRGAPLSLAVVAPALAGPFDLGNVVVRAALHVHPERAQVTAISDPFPTILHGVILRTRDVRLRLDRPQTTINPTSCARMAIEGEVGGAGGALFNTSSPFQVGSCGDLRFKPRLSLRLFGGTKRGAHPKLRAVLRMPPGGANIGAASVALPRSEFLDQSHIKTICTRVQFAREACPQGSIYGTVMAKTPLLDETLRGNIYLRSSENPLPDLVAAFRGGKIDANVIGRIDSVRGGIRNTFDFVPDVPVTEAVFSFFGGNKGLLINSRDICARTYRARARFRGQNGARHDFKPKLRAKCGKVRKAAASKKRRR